MRARLIELPGYVWRFTSQWNQTLAVLAVALFPRGASEQQVSAGFPVRFLRSITGSIGFYGRHRATH